MQLQWIARSLVAGVGIFSLGIAGYIQARNAEAKSPPQTATATLQPASLLKQSQVAQNSPSQAPTRPPDVVYIPTPMPVVRKMLQLANVKPNDVVYDLGSGDGRIVITAAKRYGARGIGIDISSERIREANENAKRAGVSDRVEFRQHDLFQANFSEATVVTLYLLKSLNVKLRPKLLSELKPGTRIVSHAFDMGDWKPDKVVVVDGNTVYYWVVPEKPPANLRQS